jgi:histidinol-phosphate/aromatic aminotransferase/cobyric acid decarboxylase-like protein
MIKDCNSKTSLEGKNYIRLSVRDNIDNDRLVDALMELG